jgi:hypothetical protein
MEVFMFNNFWYSNGMTVSQGGFALKGSGENSYKNMTIPSIKYEGILKLSNMIISGPVSVNGELKVLSSHMHSLKVDGDAKMEKSTVSGNTVIDGLLKAISCCFQGLLSIRSSYVVLEHSDLQSITVKQNSSRHDREQQLLLKGTTIVHGDIRFETGQGKVFLSNEARVYGQIFGAEVIRDTMRSLPNFW